jgi:hypothetical protein
MGRPDLPALPANPGPRVNLDPKARPDRRANPDAKAYLDPRANPDAKAYLDHRANLVLKVPKARPGRVASAPSGS